MIRKRFQNINDHLASKAVLVVLMLVKIKTSVWH